MRNIPDEFLSSRILLLSPMLQEIDEEVVRQILDSSDARIILDPQIYQLGREGNLELVEGIDAFEKTQ